MPARAVLKSNGSRPTAGAHRLGLRRVLHIRDRDELARPALEKLLRSRTVHVLARREIENYLLDPAALATVLASRVPQGTSAPGADAIGEAVSAAAEDLRNTIIINRVARQIAPAQRLMDNDLRHELADAGADADGVMTEVLKRLTAPTTCARKSPKHGPRPRPTSHDTQASASWRSPQARTSSTACLCGSPARTLSPAPME